MQKNNKARPYLSLHLIILIFGFTGILGRYIDTPPTALTIYRTGLTCVCLGAFMWLRGMSFRVGWRNVVLLLLSGGVIGIHWVLFFSAIKQANVSVTVAMLSTGALFASLLEPLFYHRRLRAHEIVFGLIVVGGIFLISGQNAEYHGGIVTALAASFVSACYSIINSKWFVRFPNDAVMISFYEMAGAVVVVAALFAPTEGFVQGLGQVSLKDALGILFLAVVCTSYTNVRMIQLFRYLSPFTVMLNINLEPVYAMLMAAALYPDERMSGAFYLGAAIILSVVVLNAWLNNLRERRKAKRLPTQPQEGHGEG